MRRALFAAVFVAALALNACSSASAPGAAAPTTPSAADTATPTAAATASAPAVSALPPGQKTYQATQTTSDGYKQTMTLTLYPAIPGRDLAVVNAAWAGVGGTGDVPCQNAAGLDMYTGVSIPTQNSVYAVGTLTIVNETPDFGGGDMMWDFAGPDANGYAMGFGYSDGAECDSLSSGTLTRPHWSGSTWGPVPIVVAYGNVVNPNHPDGDYAKIAAEPIALPMGNAAITAGGASVAGITVVAADATWLEQARTQA